MTPHELNLALEAYNDKLQYDREQAAIQAYYTAVWARWVKKPPKINEVLRKLKPAEPLKPMSPEEQLRQVMRWQKRFEMEKGES